ncbi:MAG: peptidylprolyl isomerase [Gemmatimonadetes bacterium]|nr:peptidylprolyl isomerase [Gemmatimonadota bacterium]|tara:strand:- start:3372 stop:3860 length:489 start_codon:yes stop_codon:yes gene_type:complete
MSNPIVTIETNLGTIEAELYEDAAPKTVANFIDLATHGYYDDVIFHRVIDSFMIQGGDPDGTGMGGPGYTIPCEFGEGLAHSEPGMFSMANAGPNTGGSQFFITLAATPWLDGKHAIFGKVSSGLEVVQAIGRVQTGASDRPVEDVVMEKVTVTGSDLAEND